MIKLTLCKEKCCPVVELVGGQFVIKDDFGGRVSLTPSQLKILVDNYPVLHRELMS